MFSVLPMITLIRYGGCKVELAVPLILSLSKDGVREGLPGGEIWFDRLTMSGLLMGGLLMSGLRVVNRSVGGLLAVPLILSLSKDGLREGLSSRERWFDKLTMSGFCSWRRLGASPNS